MTPASKSTRLACLCALGAAVLLLVSAASASAAAPAWHISSLANTTALPDGTITYYIEDRNVGTAAADGSEIKTTIALPSGVAANSATGEWPENWPEGPQLSCTGAGGGALAGASSLECITNVPVEGSHTIAGGTSALNYKIVTHVESSVVAPKILTASFQVEGGGAAAPAHTVDPTRIEGPPPFGIDAFDAQVTSDASGDPSTQAAGHPYAAATSIDFNTVGKPGPMFGDLWPVESTKDVVVDPPPGLVGNASGLERCTSLQLVGTGGSLHRTLCPEGSQVGTAFIRLNSRGWFAAANSWGPIAVFDMVPPPGVAARFSFNIVGTIITLDAKPRGSAGYGLSVVSHDIPQALATAGTTVTFWGVPADPIHDAERFCTGQEDNVKGCSSPDAAEPHAFLRNPTSCTAKANEGLPTIAYGDSWQHPGALDENGEPVEEAAWQSATSFSHEAPGYPYPPHGQDEGGPEQGEEAGIEGCEGVPFEPEIEAAPTTNQADSPSGLSFDLRIPQSCWEEGEENSICQSDLKEAKVTLPEGMSVNPSSADGLGACSASEIGLITPEGSTPIHFNTADPSCPDSSKLGTVKIQTPLIEEELEGAVYLAKQGDNPFKSLLALYIVVKANGIIVKLPLRVQVDPGTGRLTTIVKDNPQLPFSHLHLNLSSGPRAALITPPTCGKYSTEAQMSPWSGNPASQLQSSFEITSGPSGQPCPPVPAAFNPKLSAGTKNPLAGTYSPFSLRITREDASQVLSGIKLAVPPGLLADLRGIPYCPDSAIDAVPTAEGTGAAQLASPSCPAASAVGTVIAGAGAGPNPLFVQTGKAYWAGPYKGAPVSLAIVTPALAGPFDLGNVVVRTGFEVDPETARITAVSDPLPTALHGIPLDLRDVRVNLDRPNYTLNPTSCNPMAFEGTLTGIEGATANVSDRFQVGNCGALGFKPKLSLKLKGKTNRGAHPSISTTLTMPPGGANIARTQVTLPRTELLENAHIRNVCTRVQFSAGACPAASIYGYARAYSPILDYYLAGPVYLRSSSHELPDLVAALRGPASQPIEVDLDGRIDSVHGRIRATFEGIPDAPVSKFVLTMQSGKKGLLVNGPGLCSKKPHATVLFDAQNGKTSDSSPAVATECGRKAHKHHKGYRR